MPDECMLLENERIDDLERCGLKLIQSGDGFCFGIDAVLLSGFAAEGFERKPVNDPHILDLCTGNGVLPILLYAKIQGQPGKKKNIAGLEIQEKIVSMARRSVMLNGIEDEIEIVRGDVKEASSIFGRASFDMITCNPPYMKKGAGLVNPDESKALARHELLCTFEDIARETAAMLKPQGRFYLVHRPHRLVDILNDLRKYRLEPKRIRMVHSYQDSEATLFLLEATSGGNAELKIEKPLIIYKEEGKYTDEIKDIYGF